MEDLDLHHIFQLALILIMVAAGITAIAKKLKQPYPIALVLIGTFIGITPIPFLSPLKFFTEGEIFNFAIITLFLPALLGEAALKLPFKHLYENRKPILALAFGGTFLSFLMIGFLSYFSLPLSLSAAFVFAALMSATDPVSVLSIFKSVGVPKRLATVIEGESLFNDGLAVVLFNISAFSLLSYIDLGWQGALQGTFEFVRVISLGLLTGGSLGYIFSLLTKSFDDYPLEIIFSIILFYSSFLLAEQIHASGVIAVVVAALIFGNFGAKIGMSPSTKLNINNFWDVAALLANSIVFLMVGLEITRVDISNKWPLIVIALFIVLIARSIAVYGSLLFSRNMSNAWKHILNWGGLKGSLSIALVLSLPYDFEGRETILILAFSVVLFSLLVQGLTIKPLIKKLNILKKGTEEKEYERLLCELHRFERALNEIDHIKKEFYIAEPVANELRMEYEKKINGLHYKFDELYNRSPHLKDKQKNTLQKHVLYAEHEAITTLEKEDIISSDMSQKQVEEIYDELVKQENGHA
ncbi:Na+/H+ antiporter [Bacillus sp. FJAT-47783]|uniref:Na+/H+ antiporter n=1 Tax=Bacillus sp. FJAT-47783 TaxID=2922712 RepID=UPI001FACA57F|nr:Na+/H+ antiporter [Bacillus sp. FJAT-47783]